MKTNIRALVLSTAVVTALFFTLAALSPVGRADGLATESKNANVAYILREYDGRLAIFKEGDAQPHTLLEVDVFSLPERDIARLREGITAATLREALYLAEDYE